MMTLLSIFFTSQIAACASQTIYQTGYFMKSCICDFYLVSVKYLQSINHRNIPFQVGSGFPMFSSERVFNYVLQLVIQFIQIQFSSGIRILETDIVLGDHFNKNIHQNNFSTINKDQIKLSVSFPVLLKHYPVNPLYEGDFVRGIFHASPLFTRY